MKNRKNPPHLGLLIGNKNNSQYSQRIDITYLVCNYILNSLFFSF